MQRLDGAVDFLGIANVATMFRFSRLTSTLMSLFESRCSLSWRDVFSRMPVEFTLYFGVPCLRNIRYQKTPPFNALIYSLRQIVSSNPRMLFRLR